MRIHIISLGCPKNTVDSEVMAGLLRDAGHELVGEPAAAEAVVINTCGFIEPARREAIDTIMEIVALKERSPDLRVVVAGCLVQRYREELAAAIPEVDAFLGVNEIGAIARLVEHRRSVEPPARSDVGAPGRSNAPGFQPEPPATPADGPMDARAPETLFLYDHATPRARLTPAHYAYVKIAEGCSHRCSFCAIPAIRGPLRSRPTADILAEAGGLLAAGVREIILIGQDTTAYGRDLSEPAGISGLLAALAGIAGENWIRLMYTYPGEIGEALLATMASHPQICPYLDIPLQHSHPDVLRPMGRPGDGDSYLKLLERVRAMVPGIAIRSTLITGFPGESEDHFRHLLEFVREACFDHLGVFSYSDEEGTPAFRLAGKVPPATADRRQATLMKEQRRLLRRGARRWLGRTLPAIVDGYQPEAELLIQARLPQQAPEIDGVTYLVEGSLDGLRQGSRVNVRLKKYLDYDFTAEVLGSSFE